MRGIKPQWKDLPARPRLIIYDKDLFQQFFTVDQSDKYSHGEDLPLGQRFVYVYQKAPVDFYLQSTDPFTNIIQSPGEELHIRSQDTVNSRSDDHGALQIRAVQMPIPCPQCPEIFIFKEDLASHIADHSSKKNSMHNPLSQLHDQDAGDSFDSDSSGDDPPLVRPS